MLFLFNISTRIDGYGQNGGEDRDSLLLKSSCMLENNKNVVTGNIVEKVERESGERM